jgi:NADPH:quinone reductase-like Zn-dependent oxidoreductase
LIGYDASGTVVAIGSGVSRLVVGDEVYTRIPSVYRGTVAEYAISTEAATAKKPASLTHTEAASIPLATLTALQSLRRADAALQPGGLAGKAVLIPAALSGTGSAAIQLALTVFSAARVVATVSGAKLARARELLDKGDNRLQLIDYRGSDVVAAVGRGTVDFFFDTQGLALKYLPLVRQPGGMIRSISTVPPGSVLAQITTAGDKFLRWIGWVFDLADWFYRWWIGRKGVAYAYDLMQPSREDLEDLARWVDEGKFQPIVGSTARLSDVQAVRDGCMQVFQGRGGGVGKFVIEIE